MANEITITCSMSASKGGASINTVGPSGTASDTFDMSGSDMATQTQSVSNSAWGALDTGVGVALPAFVIVVNLDDTDYLTIADNNSGTTPCAVLPPGARFMSVVPNGTTLYAKSTTSDGSTNGAAALNAFIAACET